MEYYFILYFSAIILSFFFSGTETGYLTLKLEKYKAIFSKKNQSNKVIYFIQNSDRLLGLTLFGNNLANIIATEIGLLICIQIFAFKNNEAEALFNLITMFLLFSFGEVIPKILFRSKAPILLHSTAKILYFFNQLFSPFINAIMTMSDFFLLVINKFNQILFIGRKKNYLFTTNYYQTISHQDISLLLSNSRDEGLVSQNEIQFFNTILSLSRIPINNIMHPLTHIFMCTLSQNINEILNSIPQNQVVIPIYNKRIDNIIGHVNLIDIVYSTKNKKSLKDFLIPAIYILESTTIDRAYQKMNEIENSTLVLIDEYGGCTGLLFRHDIIGTIFNLPAQGNFKKKERAIRKIKYENRDAYEINTSISIQYLNQNTNLNIPKGKYKTLTGFILSCYNGIPPQGKIIDIHNIVIFIKEIKMTTIKKVIIYKKNKSKAK